MVPDLKTLYEHEREIPGTSRKVLKGKGKIKFGTLLYQYNYLFVHKRNHLFGREGNPNPKELG